MRHVKNSKSVNLLPFVRPRFACRVRCTLKGFLNTTLEVDDASLEIEEAFPSCKVLPASKLQLNQTGIENGDVTYLTASFSVGGGRGEARWRASGSFLVVGMGGAKDDVCSFVLDSVARG